MRRTGPRGGKGEKQGTSISAQTSNEHFVTINHSPCVPLTKTKRTNLTYSLVPFRSSSIARVPQSNAKISVHRLFYAQFYDLHLPVIKRGRPARYVYLKTLFITYHIGRTFARARAFLSSIHAESYFAMRTAPLGCLAIVNFSSVLIFYRKSYYPYNRCISWRRL